MDIKALTAVASSIRSLTIDGVEKSGTGHPGMALGCADLGAVLFGEILKHYNKAPDWPDRDRFVLSAGHGSMLLYTLLHLSGYDLPKEELMQFRRVGSRTPGHPEYGLTFGVETTTGPLGAGFATAVGMAVAEKKLAAGFNTPEHTVFDHYTYVLSGDGCMMEGVTGEAASFAGHFELGKLIVFYDSNQISIEGSTSITFTEDVAARFRAYNWQTLEGSAHDPEEIARLVEAAKQDRRRPSLIVLHSVIGKGAPNKEGKHEVHGKPLGKEEAEAAKRNLGVPEDEQFYVFPEAYDYFAGKGKEWDKKYKEWNMTFSAWGKANPKMKQDLEAFLDQGRPWYGNAKLPSFAVGDSVAGRDVSGKMIAAYADAMENFVGGSADLSSTTKTEMPGHPDFRADTPEGKVIRFGVREHAMASIVSGLTIHGGFRAFCGTILIFADYMRPAMRLAALMRLPVIYILTHDSIFIGGDGPTHQPVEHLTSLRIIPNMMVLRPADPEEVVEAWQMAMERKDGPAVLALSRQPVKVFPKHDPAWRGNMRKGAYVVREPDRATSAGDRPDIVIAATGSEVDLALEAAELVPEKRTRVVSVTCRELLMQQPAAFREALFPAGVRTIVAEAGVTCCWEGIASSPKDVFGINRFGASGPGDEVAEHIGYTAEGLAKLIREE